MTDAVEQMRKYREQLAASPVVDVLGVVSANGAGGAKSGRDEPWTLQFTLNPWRFPGGKLQSKVLDVHRQVTDEELERFRNMLKPYIVVRIKARVGVLPHLGFPDALLDTFVGLDTSDAELNEKAAELQRPVMFDDPTFGTFTLDRTVQWFSADTVWLGQPVSLNLSATEPKEIEDALKVAHALWQDQAGWTQRVQAYAVQKLLPLKNEVWLEEDETELTAEQFIHRMTLESITVNPDGSFDFWHDNGDLFWGHSIQVSGDVVKGLRYAGKPG